MQIFLSILTSFIISLMMIPSLIAIARQRKIFDAPGIRKLHSANTPLLGGIAIFAGTLISVLFWGAQYFELRYLFVFVSLLILFFTGSVDDLRPLFPSTKLFMQIVASFITVTFAHLSINGFHGLFGIHSLNSISSIVISVFFILLVVNSYNFIDGIDGLATSIGIISSALFGILFLSLNDMLLSLLSFSLCGALVAFLFFNLAPAKIFMGDTGTMIIGFVLSLLAIQLTEETRMSVSSFHWLNYLSAPVITLALLIIPVVDFLRVTFVRIINGRSPIRGDRNHIHHVLVRAGFTHLQTTIILIAVNLIFFSSAFFLRNINQTVLFFCFLVSGILLSQIPYLLLRRKTTKIPL